jgi:putative flippase GtrA
MKNVAAKAMAVWGRNRQLRFIVVGVSNTVFGYACFATIFLAVGGRVHYLLIQLIAHLLSVCNAFVWHRRVTFRSESPWPKQFVRFNLSYLGALAFGLVAMPALVAGFGLHPLLAAAIVTIATVGLSYALHNSFSFSSRPQ